MKIRTDDKDYKRVCKKVFSGDKTGHDWSHTYRVWKTALKIGKTEKMQICW